MTLLLATRVLYFGPFRGVMNIRTAVTLVVLGLLDSWICRPTLNHFNHDYWAIYHKFFVKSNGSGCTGFSGVHCAITVVNIRGGLLRLISDTKRFVQMLSNNMCKSSSAGGEE